MTEKADNSSSIPCKLILVGESGVGKTSIISRYLNKYQEKTELTLGAYFSNKTINCDGYQINFEIWDTAGQEQYRSMNTLFYKDASICLMVYDITNRNTFDSIKDYWYESVKESGNEGIIFGIAGNKNDLFEDEEVTESEAKEFSDSINACFKLTSAQLNTSIDDIFQMLGEKFLMSKKELLPKIDKNIKNDENLLINKNDTIKLEKDASLKSSSTAHTIKSKKNCC